MAAGGCAAALRPPPSMADLAGAAPGAETQTAADLLAEAAQAYARRPDETAVRQAEQLWLRAAAADSNEVGGLIGAVRAKVWLANHLGGVVNKASREDAAKTAVQAAQWCEVRAPENPACDYWLALVLGVQSRERTSTAHSGLDAMVERLRRAIESSPELDSAGPDRVLARVLIDAPGWPTGPGDPDEGLIHAQAAVARFGDYPPNVLTLAKALAKVGRCSEAREQYRRARDEALRGLGESHPDATEWLEEANRGLE